MQLTNQEDLNNPLQRAETEGRWLLSIRYRPGQPWRLLASRSNGLDLHARKDHGLGLQSGTFERSAKLQFFLRSSRFQPWLRRCFETRAEF